MRLNDSDNLDFAAERDYNEMCDYFDAVDCREADFAECEPEDSLDLDDEPLNFHDDDGQPDEYTEWQDYMGGDDWDHGQYDEY